MTHSWKKKGIKLMAHSHYMGQGQGLGNGGFLYYTMYSIHCVGTGTGIGDHCVLLYPFRSLSLSLSRSHAVCTLYDNIVPCIAWCNCFWQCIKDAMRTKPVYRDKGTLPKRKGGPVFWSKTTPIPEAQGAEGVITSPLPSILEPPEHDHHLPFYFSPQIKKTTELKFI